MLAGVGFLSSVSPEVHLEVAFLEEVHFAEGAVEVGDLIQVCILLVKSESRVTRV